MKSLLLFVFCFSLCVGVFAQEIRYEFSAPNAAHHEAEITLSVKGLPAGPALFRMSRSSPGRYATHEFGKNVYNIKATDATGKPIVIEKVDADVYRVIGHKGIVSISYTLFGNYADGTYAEIDPVHFHLNMPAAFMWVKGFDKAPITLHFTLPSPDWKIATQLKPTADPMTFSAPGLQYFMDSPTKAGQMAFREWTIANPNKKEYRFRLALEAAAEDRAVDSFAANVQRIVKEAQAVYGEVPSYDYGTYTFLAGINPYVHGDGMEHRNSTMITIPTVFTGSPRLLGVFAHEFFHNWNVERIRPKSLEPFNFEKSNMSEALWIAEGFTQYYGGLLVKRAGFASDEEFFREMAGLINAKEVAPGGRLYTPIENSQRAVFVDAGVSIDRTNYANMFSSYYPYGGALALALDLQLRKQFGKSMDNFMQELWKRFGKSEKPYTLPDVQNALAAVSSAAFAADFFRKHVYGHESIDYAPLLEAAGLQLVKQGTGKAWLGNVRYTVSNSNLVLRSPTAKGTPLYEAGVDIDDTLLQLDGKELKSTADLEAVLSNHKPGDAIGLVYNHRGQKQEGSVTLAEDPAFSILPLTSSTAAQTAFKAVWLGTKVQ